MSSRARNAQVLDVPLAALNDHKEPLPSATIAQTQADHLPPLVPTRSKRTREEQDEDTASLLGQKPKRLRQSSQASTSKSATRQKSPDRSDAPQRSLIEHWIESHTWPAAHQLFIPSMMESMLPVELPLPSLRRRRSDVVVEVSAAAGGSKTGSSTTAAYNTPRAELLLSENKSYMKDHHLGFPSACKELCRRLLTEPQPIPQDTLFRDDIFEKTCTKLDGKNEARISKDSTPLIVPSAETLAIMGSDRLDILAESVDEGWNSCRPIFAPRPQPDYAVGFGPSAFSDDQLTKLGPIIGCGDAEKSWIMVAWSVYFPFLTCEVKRGSVSLELAARQNAHSMTVALRGLVRLFSAVKREQELDRQVLGFSVAHDNRSVRLYAHYPVIDGAQVTYWRHLVDEFMLARRGGIDKWTAYTFIRNIYDLWMPGHLKRICSAIDMFDLDEAVKWAAPPSLPDILPSLENSLFAKVSVHQVAPEVTQQVTPDASSQAAMSSAKRQAME